MPLRCASAPQFYDRVPDDRAGGFRALVVFFSLVFVFLLIPNLIFYCTVRGLAKFKTPTVVIWSGTGCQESLARPDERMSIW